MIQIQFDIMLPKQLYNILINISPTLLNLFDTFPHNLSILYLLIVT